MEVHATRCQQRGVQSVQSAGVSRARVLSRRSGFVHGMMQESGTAPRICVLYNTSVLAKRHGWTHQVGYIHHDVRSRARLRFLDDYRASKSRFYLYDKSQRSRSKRRADASAITTSPQRFDVTRIIAPKLLTVLHGVSFPPVIASIALLVEKLKHM